jgi:hypothetical protein
LKCKGEILKVRFAVGVGVHSEVIYVSSAHWGPDYLAAYSRVAQIPAPVAVRGRCEWATIERSPALLRYRGL